MSESVHGRNVLKMIIASNRSWPHSALIEAMAVEFGESASFHTCSTQGMTAEQLVALFLSKGKLVESADGLAVDPEKMCGHHHHH